MLEHKLKLDLSDMPGDNVEDETFNLIKNYKDEKYKSLIDKCLTVEKDKIFEKDGKNYVMLNIKFYPLRPFKTECEFIISKGSGGQWIYTVILEALEPEPDDIIHIQSSLYKVSFVYFKLDNIFTKYTKFVAYFSHDSSSEFGVQPREGVLNQSGKEGTTFKINYRPIEYGKVKKGKLIIETDEVQWWLIK